MIFGIDISNYQAGIHLAQVKAEGFDFVLAKVTEGATYRNPSWPVFRDQARAAGLLLAGYHYVRTGNPAGEAAACKAYLGDTSIPIMLDWEQNGGDFHNFLTVLNAFRAAGLRVPLGYLPRWYWQQQGSPPITGFGLGLVSSRYPTASGGTAAAIYRSVTATTWSAYGGLTPTILQFTDRATVAGRQVDANAFLGTRADLAALLGTTPSPTPRPSEEDFLATMNDQEKALLLEAASSVLFGIAGVRAAGPLALSVNSVGNDVLALRREVEALAAKPAGTVDSAEVARQVAAAVIAAGLAEPVIDALAERLRKPPV